MKGRFVGVFFAGMLGQIIIRAPHDLQRRKRAQVEQRGLAIEGAIMAELTLGTVALPLLYGLTARLDRADYPFAAARRRSLGLVGTALLIPSLWLFWRAHRDLGANWNPTMQIREGQTISEEGVYGVVRHPMYASTLLFGLSQALLIPNWVAGLGELLAFFLLAFVRAPQEERQLRDHFGPAYDEYAARVGRILPRLR